MGTISRRGLLGTLLALPFMPALKLSRKREGFSLDVRNSEDWPLCMRARAFLNGEDVTSRCFYASTVAQAVGCYQLRDGRPYVENGKVVREYHFGRADVWIFG